MQDLWSLPAACLFRELVRKSEKPLTNVLLWLCFLQMSQNMKLFLSSFDNHVNFLYPTFLEFMIIYLFRRFQQLIAWYSRRWRPTRFGRSICCFATFLIRSSFTFPWFFCLKNVGEFVPRFSPFCFDMFKHFFS